MSDGIIVQIELGYIDLAANIVAETIKLFEMEEDLATYKEYQRQEQRRKVAKLLNEYKRRYGKV